MKEFDKFQEDYNKYGKNDFLRLMFALLGIKLPRNLDSINVDFIPEKSAITIRNGKNIDYTLYLFEDYIVFFRNKKNYITETNYSYKFEPYQNTVYFKGQYNTIALQETRLANFKSRRLISYKDNQATYPEYEKEIIEFNGKNVECINNYQNASKQMQTYKVMRMENCIYYYHFQKYPDNPYQPYTSFLEVASTTNVPKLNIFNRLNEEEALRDVISIPAPNIFISGTIKNNGGEPDFTYRIKIRKDSSHINISVLEINIKDFNENTKEKSILTDDEGELTIAELSRIIDILKNMLPTPLLLEVIPELQNIQNNINIRNNNTKIGDFLDCNLNFYTNFNTLALDVFKNLSTYERFIKLFTQKQKESNQLRLTKK